MFQNQVKVGLVQMRCGEDREKNLRKAIRGIEECAAKGAKIICLPELFLSKYFCHGPKKKEYFLLAETIPGPITSALGVIARQHKVVILCSLFEKTGGADDGNGGVSDGRNSNNDGNKSDGSGSSNNDAPKKGFNSLAAIGTDGKIIGIYRKMHIPSLPPDYYAEDFYFEKGREGVAVFETPFGKIAPMICYDQWFPEGARIAAAKGAQILFYPTAIGWPKSNPQWKKTAEHGAWQIVQRAHAIENNIFVVAVNRIGTEGDLKFWGTSFVSDPYGRVLVSASTDHEENLVVALDIGVTEIMREEWPFLQERRLQVENCKPN